MASLPVPPLSAAVESAGNPPRPRILILTSSLLTDRMLGSTSVLPRLAEHAEVRVLASSFDDAEASGAWPDLAQTTIAPFPETTDAPFLPGGLLRLLADEAWESRHRPVSRIRPERDGGPVPGHAWLRTMARSAGLIGASPLLGRAATAAALRRPVTPAISRAVAEFPPDLTVVTSPFHTYQLGMAAEARRKGSRVVALVPSWDNLTTKGRMFFNYDAFFVWSEAQAKVMRSLYPQFADRLVHIVGAPQYDAFTDPAMTEERELWCLRHGLDPFRPIVLYALGSPNMFDEVPAVATLARAVAGGRLGHAQLLVRCHPVHDTPQIHAALAGLGTHVHVQRTAIHPDAAVRDRTHSRDQLADWVNTFHHVDVVVNLSSTSAIDGMVFDRPIVNLDYDPGPGGRRNALVKDINRRWEHFAPVAQSGAMALVGNADELVDAVGKALAGEDEQADLRAQVVRQVIGSVDGRAGDRFAAAVLDHIPRTDEAPGHGGHPPGRVHRLRGIAGRTWQKSRKEWRWTWRWGHNLPATLRYVRTRPRLSPPATEAVEDLRFHGIAMSEPGVLIPQDLVDAVRSEVDRIEAGQVQEIARSRALLTQGGSDAEKVFLHQPLGDPVPLDLDSPFARVAELLAPIADAYFGLETQVRAYAVWHNLASDGPATDSQLWHRDREDLQILKTFLYLDHVDSGHGPFWYAPGTHRRGTERATARSRKIRGVDRSGDEDVAAVVAPTGWFEAVGSAGSIVLADTRGYHKGGHATAGDRRLLVVLFTSPDSGTREWFDRTACIDPADAARRRRWARG